MQIHQFPVFACIFLIFSDFLRFSLFYSFIGFLKIFSDVQAFFTIKMLLPAASEHTVSKSIFLHVI